MPSSLHARIMRRAISPRLAIRMRLNMSENADAVLLANLDLEQRLIGVDGSPSSTSTATIFPRISAGISLNDFMASMMQTVVFAST